MSLPPTLSPTYFGVSLKPGGAVTRYFSAVGATIVAAVLTQAVLHWMGSTISPVFPIAVVIVSAYAGLRPGLLCAVLSAIACNVLFVSSVGAEDLIRLAAFMIVALLVSSLTMARQEAEAAAKAAEKQLSITLKSIGNAVITTDAKGRVIFMNSIAQSLTGWFLPEASGRHIEEIFHIVHPETKCALETVATRVLRDSVVLALGDPAHMIARDGTRIYVDQVGAPVRDHRGNIKGLVVVLRTIPEPKPNDPDRLLAETIGLLDGVDVNMLAIDLDKRCAFVSKSTGQLLGYQAHELVGREIHELPGFHDLEVFSDAPPVKNKKNVLSSGTLQQRDGTAVPVEFSRAPLVIAEQVVGTVITITDLTERRRAETAITRLESIENSVDEGIILHTADGVISSWNRAAERIYGYCEEEVLGRHISIIHTPGYKQELEPLFDRVLQQKRIGPLETVRIRKGGERVFVSINVVLLDDGLNAAPCIAQIITDQTLLKKVEATALLARNSSNGNVSASVRRVNRTAKGNSSDLSDQATINAPLTSPTTRVKAKHSPVLIGTSPVMKKLFTTIDRVAATDNSVLITGQTGTGKELVARAIHNKSQRANGRFIDLNCSAIPETLIEAELFGHQRGTFTGAHENRAGLFEAASGGTLFLDEVDALPLAAQAKLLRVIQEKRIRRVGGRTNIDIDVRIISATNSDLSTAINEGRFRADLFYRLRVFPVSVPALSQRGGDVEMLIEYFLGRHAELYGTLTKSFTPAAMNALLRYSWLGNVRELESAVEYALAISTEEELGVEDLPTEFSAADASTGGPVTDFLTNRAPLAEIEKRYILSVLEQFDGNQVRAAAALGIDRSKLYRRLRQYGVKAVKFLQEEQGDGRQLLSSRNGKPQVPSNNSTDQIAQRAAAA